MEFHFEKCFPPVGYPSHRACTLWAHAFSVRELVHISFRDPPSSGQYSGLWARRVHDDDECMHCQVRAYSKDGQTLFSFRCSRVQTNRELWQISIYPTTKVNFFCKSFPAQFSLPSQQESKALFHNGHCCLWRTLDETIENRSGRREKIEAKKRATFSCFFPFQQDRNFNSSSNYFSHSNSRYGGGGGGSHRYELGWFVCCFGCIDHVFVCFAWKQRWWQTESCSAVDCHQSSLSDYMRKFKRFETSLFSNPNLVPFNIQDVIHQICSPNGKVIRIVIFKKNGIQAMVEFDTLDSAKRAKHALNGCDIYSGCCTLRVEYAKVRNLVWPTRLGVPKNSSISCG